MGIGDTVVTWTAVVLWRLYGYPFQTVASKFVAKSMSKTLLGKKVCIVALGEIIMCAVTAVYNYTFLVVCHSLVVLYNLVALLNV